MAYCTNCSATVKPGSQFCTSCGAKLSAASEESAHSGYGALRRYYTKSGLRRFELEVTHGGLGRYQVIRSDDQNIVVQKARAKVKQWNESWERKQQAERVRSQREQKAQALAEHTRLAADRTQEAQEALKALEGILAYTIDIDDTVNWEALKDDAPFPVPEPGRPTAPTILREPHRSDPKYRVELGLLDRMITSWGEKKAKEAERRFDVDHQAWQAEKEKRSAVYDAQLQEYEAALAAWEQEREALKRAQEQSNAAIDAQKVDYSNGEASAILDYCDLVLSNSRYPDGFPQTYELDYSPENKILIVDYQLPSLTDLPTLSEVRYIQSRDEFTEKHISQAPLNRNFNSVLYQIALRTIHELYEADQVDVLASIVFNGYVRSIDPATGQEVNPCVLSVQAGKEEFEQIRLANVDPRACFKNLKGISGTRLQSMTPIAPILRIDREDSRFVEAYGVADSLQEGDNLAAMDWEDFEHLIREVFEKEFAIGGGEVKVTRASRDGGVDAVAFDPDPIRGGKIVIQAKRYTGTVGVSAVRDLYGTVVNEGANKGIIVTTSHYGPDAYEFARGKPLTLIDGNNLLHLLEKHGHRARIDVQEARRLLSAD